VLIANPRKGKEVETPPAASQTGVNSRILPYFSFEGI